MISVPSTVAHAEQEQLLEQLRALLANVDAGARELYEQWRPSLRRRAFVPGARNFAAYLALRRTGLRSLQTPLELSSLGRCVRIVPMIRSTNARSQGDRGVERTSLIPMARHISPELTPEDAVAVSK